MPDDSIIDRIKKLLALSRSSNVHEAAAAAARAHELMLSHKLSAENIESAGIYVEKLTGDKFMEIWRWGLLTACAWSYYTHTIRTEDEMTFGPKRITAHVIGRKDDVLAVIYLFTYFEAELERLADSDDEISGKDARDNFLCGASLTIQKRLLHQRKTVEASSDKALVLGRRSNKDIETYVKKEFGSNLHVPRMHTFVTNAFTRGQSAAEKVVGPHEGQRKLKGGS
jgi:hypothetical protein